MILKIRSTTELNEQISIPPHKIYMKLSVTDDGKNYTIDPCIYNQQKRMFIMKIRDTDRLSPKAFECIQALISGINRMIS